PHRQVSSTSGQLSFYSVETIRCAPLALVFVTTRSNPTQALVKVRQSVPPPPIVVWPTSVGPEWATNVASRCVSTFVTQTLVFPANQVLYFVVLPLPNPACASNTADSTVGTCTIGNVTQFHPQLVGL